MNEAKVFGLTDRALNGVVGRIGEDQWEMEVDEGLVFREGDRTLRDLVNHFASDESWVPDVLAGRTSEEVGDKYQGDLLGDDPKQAFAELVDRAIKSVNNDYDPDRTTHLSYGDFPAKTYLMHITVFRAIGIVEISKLIDAKNEMSDELAQQLFDLIAPEADGLRAIGVFPPEVQVPRDASPQDRLLGIMGRHPE
jgi:uncharacterized protein (TIGR03086 family)